MPQSASPNAPSQPVIGKDWSFSRRVLAFISIMMVYFFYDLNWMIDGNIRHSLISTYGFSFTQVSMIFSSLELGTIPGTLLFGMIAAKTSKKRTLMLLALMMGCFTLLPLISPGSLTVWLGSRFIAGLALGGCFGTSIALVVDLFPSKSRAIFASILCSSFAIGIQVSGYMYSIMGSSGWKLLLTVCAVGPIIGMVAVALFVPDDFNHMQTIRQKQSTSKSKDGISYFAMYRNHTRIGISVLLLSACNFLGYALFNNNALHYMTDALTLSHDMAGQVFMCSGLGLFIGYYFWGIMAGWKGRKIGLFGFFIAAVAMFCYLNLGAEHLTLLYPFSFMIGFGFGCTSYWGVYYTELFPEKYRPIAAGISFNGGRLATSFAIPTIAASSHGNISVVFTWAIAAVILGACIWSTLPETLTKKRSSKEDSPATSRLQKTA